MFMQLTTYLSNGLMGAVAALFVGGPLVPGAHHTAEPASAKAVAVTSVASATERRAPESVTGKIDAAVRAFSSAVRPLSHPKALETAFSAYYAYKSAHPEQVRKPYLYFVDYGQPSTKARGYLFDMSTLRVVEGPFTVAHGRGSSTSQYGIPTRFSNAHSSGASSLGLYVAQNTYGFVGHSGGGVYRSVGLRLKGVSGSYNSNALARGVVAHGAPYVTSTRAGRSQGCPAMEQGRAQRLLPKLANGGMVFLFAPNSAWMGNDPWVAAAN